jgi:hypothetical protein
MRSPTARQKPRKALVTSFPAPTGGLISNRNLAMARATEGPPGACVLENMFPTATGVVLRRGSRRWASVVEGSPVRALFSYVAGATKQMFAATDAGIWNITTVSSPYGWALCTDGGDYIAADVGAELVFGEDSLSGLEVLDASSSGDWVVVQYSTAGGAFLVGVNGADDGFIYDGTDFYPAVAGGVFALEYDAETAPFAAGETLTGGTSAATAIIVKVIDGGTSGTLWLKTISGTFEDNETITSAGGSADANGTPTSLMTGITFPGGVTLTTADLAYVWVYKQRLWFIQKDSLDAWYLPVDQITGELTKWPMGGIFTRGGTLVWGHAWSLDTGASGGLSEQCVFCTTEGEVAAYQGLYPSDLSGWNKAGLYRIGRPLGKKAFIVAGGDLVIATSVGFLSLAMASRFDYAALGQQAVSYPIEQDWSMAVDARGQTDWRCQVWADGQMVLVAPPTPAGSQPVVFVANTNTGRWSAFTGWDVTAIEAFTGRLFFGSRDGAIRQAWVGGSDEDAPYVGRVLPLFDGLDAPASLKVVKMARAVTRSSYQVPGRLSGHANFRIEFPPAPDALAIQTGNEWDNGIWGESVWDASRNEIVTGDWVSVGGSGHDIAIGYQVSSGANVPVDVELVRIDLTYTVAAVGT